MIVVVRVVLLEIKRDVCRCGGRCPCGQFRNRHAQAIKDMKPMVAAAQPSTVMGTGPGHVTHGVVLITEGSGPGRMGDERDREREREGERETVCMP